MTQPLAMAAQRHLRIMELRPRKNDVLKCGFCLDEVAAASAVFLRARGAATRYATLAVHGLCRDEVIAEDERYVPAPLAYGLADDTTLREHSPPALDRDALLALGAHEVTGLDHWLHPKEHNRLVFSRGGRVHGAVLQPLQIAARGPFEMVGPERTFINVYEPLAIHADDAQLRLCLHDALGLKVVRGLVFSGGRQLPQGSYHSSTLLSTGLVTLAIGGVASVVYDRGDFIDVAGGITLSRPPTQLPAHLHPKMPEQRPIL